MPLQAVLRRRHDVLNLSLSFISARRGAVGWADFERQWEGLLDDMGDGRLGKARIYYGKLSGAYDLPLVASKELADAMDSSVGTGLEGPNEV